MDPHRLPGFGFLAARYRVSDRGMLSDCPPLGLGNVVGLGVPNTRHGLDGGADVFENGILRGARNNEMKTRIAFHERRVVGVTDLHLTYGCEQFFGQFAGVASRGAARAFHFHQDAHIDQIIEIALAEQQSPAERAGEQLGGRFSDKRSLASAGLQHAEDNQTFDRLPDGGASDLKPERELFLAGIKSPSFQTRFMMRSVRALTISCGSVARFNGRMMVLESVMVVNSQEER